MPQEIYWAGAWLALVTAIFLWGTIGWIFAYRANREHRAEDLSSMGYHIHRSVNVMVNRMVVEMMRPYIYEMRTHAEFCSDSHCVYRDLRTSCLGIEDCWGPGHCLWCDFDSEDGEDLDELHD